jgi:hypothetical protein
MKKSATCKNYISRELFKDMNESVLGLTSASDLNFLCYYLYFPIEILPFLVEKISGMIRILCGHVLFRGNKPFPSLDLPGY